LGFGSCFTEPTCSAAVVLSTGFNSDVSHPIRKKHIINYVQNQQNISSHPGFNKPGITTLIPKINKNKILKFLLNPVLSYNLITGSDHI